VREQQQPVGGNQTAPKGSLLVHGRGAGREKSGECPGQGAIVQTTGVTGSRPAKWAARLARTRSAMARRVSTVALA
jgi:hypothetical protein